MVSAKYEGLVPFTIQHTYYIGFSVRKGAVLQITTLTISVFIIYSLKAVYSQYFDLKLNIIFLSVIKGWNFFKLIKYSRYLNLAAQLDVLLSLSLEIVVLNNELWRQNCV